MPTAHHSAAVQAPVEALWARLADLESWPRWLLVPYASEAVTIASPGPTAVGTEFVLKGRMKARLFARITELEDRRHLAFEIYRSEYPSDRLFFGRPSISIELETVDAAHTRIKCTHRLEGKGAIGKLYAAVVMRPFLAVNVQRIVDSFVAAVGDTARG